MGVFGVATRPVTLPSFIGASRATIITVASRACATTIKTFCMPVAHMIIVADRILFLNHAARPMTSRPYVAAIGIVGFSLTDALIDGIMPLPLVPPCLGPVQDLYGG